VLVCASCGHENSDSAKFCEECAAPLAAAPAPREQRKTVTVLFCDVTGSTALGESTDPEALRALLARYFERMKGIVESHGGSVEKFIGDAVMAVFGVPQVHEDDALRAVRAAVEMRDALPELGVQARIGINTGEVVTGTEERLATGDAVNVAARLEQAAQPGDVLIGGSTLALVRDAVESEAVEPLTLKGKAEPTAAYRLLSVHEEATGRLETPMVGRETELRRLHDAFKQAVNDRSCQLFTVLGAAGVGKSRLAAEFLEAVDATIARGRCLPYGEGITYWPVVEVVKQLPHVELDPAAKTSLGSMLGEETAATSSDEIAWAFRKLLEGVAQSKSLVVVFDDLHWGEETFLDLVEHVADLSRDAPLLLLCMARPDLLDRRPAWAGGKLNATNVLLEPLSPGETGELIESLASELPESVTSRVVDAAEGNPLFVEEMVALARESTADEVTVPPTIQALLAARLDQLDEAERGVLGRGAVEGRVFHRRAVQALAPEEKEVMMRLTALVRKELVRPDSTQLLGEDAFRFRHLLIRDAAYDALPKAVRAELHERFAAWLEQHGTELLELDEILGYHLEQACCYKQELGLSADDELAAEARRRLTAAGRRASFRQDSSAAVRLLERAASLIPRGEIDVALETDLVDALLETGKSGDALPRAGSLAERAAAAGDRVAELCGKLKEAVCRVYLEPEGATDKLAALVEQALPVFEAAGDDLALYIGYSALGQVAALRGQWDALLDAYERAFVHAQRAGLPHELVGWRGFARLAGATSVSELLAWLDEQEARGTRSSYLRRLRGRALARLGRFDEARAILADVRAELAERGGGIQLGATTGMASVDVELLAGDPAAAAEFGAEGCRLLDELGDKTFQSTAAGWLAQALYALDRLEEADASAGRAAELGASDDAATQMLWRQVRAKVLARRGEHAEAERHAREAVALGEQTDLLDLQGDAYADLAEVLSLAGRPKEATEALEQALARYERKGNLVMAQRAQMRLAELQDAAPR
jgi:class 3 adenylate cyclase/tetratricopeptide (TPR) repeat protein